MPAPPRHLLRNLVLLGLGASLMSCGDCGEPGAPEPELEPGFTLSLNLRSLLLTVGGSGTRTIHIERYGGFYGVVSIRVEAPAGIVATPSATSVAYGALEPVRLEVSVPGALPRGDYPVRVIGSASGLPDSSDTLWVDVRETPRGGFALKVAPASLTLLPATAADAVVGVTREAPFDRLVNLAVTGLPSGVATMFMPWDWIAPDSVSTRLHVSVTAHAQPGTWPLTITGSSIDVPDSSAVLTLTVLPLPDGFSLAVNPDTLAVPQLGRGTTAVKVARVAGFDGAVALSSTDLPPGVVTTFTPTTIPASAASASLDVDVRFHVPLGTYQVPVRGAATGVAGSADTLVLVVRPGCFTMGVYRPLNDTLTVLPGQRDSATLVVLRAVDHGGDMSLTVTGAPAGVTASVSPGPVPAGESRPKVLIDVDIAKAPGIYPLTLRATGAGCPDATATLYLAIPAVGRITISTTSDVALRQGGTALVPLGIGRIAPFAGEVTLSAEGLPAGVTAVFAPATLAPDRTTAQLTYTATAAAPVGTHQVTIRATGTGVPSTTWIQYLLISPP